MGKCLIDTFISVFIEPWILLTVLVVYFVHPHSFMLMWLVSLMRVSTACGRRSGSHTAALKTHPVADVWQNWHLLWMPECHVLRKMPGTSFGMCNVTSRRQSTGHFNGQCIHQKVGVRSAQDKHEERQEYLENIINLNRVSSQIKYLCFTKGRKYEHVKVTANQSIAFERIRF